jgi:hypothetical protein
MGRPDDSSSPFISFVKGLLTGTIEAVICYPTELVKTQLQLQSKQNPQYKGMMVSSTTALVAGRLEGGTERPEVVNSTPTTFTAGLCHEDCAAAWDQRPLHWSFALNHGLVCEAGSSVDCEFECSCVLCARLCARLLKVKHWLTKNTCFYTPCPSAL